MLMCKRFGYIYYCEELFVVKHKSKHSCANAVFHELGPQQVILAKPTPKHTYAVVNVKLLPNI